VRHDQDMLAIRFGWGAPPAARDLLRPLARPDLKGGQKSTTLQTRAALFVAASEPGRPHAEREAPPRAIASAPEQRLWRTW